MSALNIQWIRHAFLGLIMGRARSSVFVHKLVCTSSTKNFTKSSGIVVLVEPNASNLWEIETE